MLILNHQVQCMWPVASQMSVLPLGHCDWGLLIWNHTLFFIGVSRQVFSV